MCTYATASGGVFSLDLVESRPGILVFSVDGKHAEEAFRGEGGGYRFQRTPPTEKRGRVHTSTITCVVLREPTPAELHLDERDLEWSTMRGSGAGGQKRNKTESCVIVKHLPTGLSVRCESERSQSQNKATALSILRARLLAQEQDRAAGRLRETRRSQAGSGMRGDKQRTIAIQRDEVIDHRTGKRMSAKNYLRGHLEDLQ